jgi:DNA-binding transcriptional LysR family regulator
MELRDIEYFAVIAEHSHLGRASEALGLGQPALSMSLRRLERAANAKLVRRTSKGIELTAVGNALLERIQRLQVARDDLTREIADIAHGKAGLLRIGVSPQSSDYVAAIYPALLAAAPGLSLQVIDSDNDELVPALQHGTLDLVVNYLTPNYAGNAGMSQVPIFEEDSMVCASADHPLTRPKRVSLTSLANERWALSTIHMWPRNVLQHVFRANGLEPPRVGVEARPVRIRLQVVSSSRLLTFISRRIFARAARPYRLKEVRVTELMVRRPVGVIYRRGAYLSPAAARFIEILKSKEGHLVTRQ